MPNYVSLTESQRRKIAVFITESQQQAQQSQLQQNISSSANNADDSVISSSSLAAGSPGGSSSSAAVPLSGNNSISCKEIVQFCKTRFGLTISLSTASRLRSSATERLATELLNPSAKRHRSVKFPEFEKALVQELKALEQEQLQIQQEQEKSNQGIGGVSAFGDPAQLPPVMTLTSEAAITQVAKGIAERMGISENDLGLTSGWYHGFKRRHGIKHRQFKPRSTNGANANGNGAGSGLGTPALAGSSSISGPGLDGGDGSDGAEGGDGDEDMEDVGQENDSKRDDLKPSKLGLGTAFDAGPGSTMDPVPNNPFMDMRPLMMMGEGSSSEAGTSGASINFLKDSLGMSNVLPPKESQASSMGLRRPEVKKVTAATANDALDVISEYLLQNGQIGATKLPLVKELRKFLLAQTELENGATTANNNVLLSVSVPLKIDADNTTTFVNDASALPSQGIATVGALGLTTSAALGGPSMVSTLNMSGNEITMQDVLAQEDEQKQLQQQQEQQQALATPASSGQHQ